MEDQIPIVALWALCGAILYVLYLCHTPESYLCCFTFQYRRYCAGQFCRYVDGGPDPYRSSVGIMWCYPVCIISSLCHTAESYLCCFIFQYRRYCVGQFCRHVDGGPDSNRGSVGIVWCYPVCITSSLCHTPESYLHCLTFSIGGIVLVSFADMSMEDQIPIGALWALCGAILYALYLCHTPESYLCCFTFQYRRYCVGQFCRHVDGRPDSYRSSVGVMWCYPVCIISSLCQTSESYLYCFIFQYRRYCVGQFRRHVYGGPDPYRSSVGVMWCYPVCIISRLPASQSGP